MVSIVNQGSSIVVAGGKDVRGKIVGGIEIFQGRQRCQVIKLEGILKDVGELKMIQKKNEEVVIVRWEKLGESESRLEAINVSLMNGKSSSVSSLPIRIKSNLLTSVIQLN